MSGVNWLREYASLGEIKGSRSGEKINNGLGKMKKKKGFVQTYLSLFLGVTVNNREWFFASKAHCL